MTDAKAVKKFLMLDDRADKLGLALSVGHENFVIEHKGHVICFTDSIEAVQCCIDAFEYCTSKE